MLPPENFIVQFSKIFLEASFFVSLTQITKSAILIKE